MITMGRSPGDPLSWKIVILLIFLLPLLPLYLWFKGRLPGLWAAGLFVALAGIYGVAAAGVEEEPKDDKRVAALAGPTPTTSPSPSPEASLDPTPEPTSEPTPSPTTSPSPVVSSTPSARPTSAKSASPRPLAKPKPKTNPTPKAKPKPKPKPKTDRIFRTCGEANSHGFGNYKQGRDPEYDFYMDRDHDGWVCEF